jgi:hypothetical protein
MEPGIGILAFILLAGGGVVSVLVGITVDRALRAGHSR